MSLNKKGQGMIVDLILLVLISSLFFIFLGTQMSPQSTETAEIRVRNNFAQKLLLSTMSYKSGNFSGATIAELIGQYHCGAAGYNPDFLSTELNSIMSKLNKNSSYFILHSTSDRGDFTNLTFACSPEVEVAYSSCCVKIEKISIAVLDLNLACGGNATVTLGVWPSNMKVEPC